MHSQDMYFELVVYFLRNTLHNSLLVAPKLPRNMVYSLTPALLGKIGVHLNAVPVGILQACWGPNTTPVVTAISDVILKPVQSDLASYTLYSDQIPGL